MSKHESSRSSHPCHLCWSRDGNGAITCALFYVLSDVTADKMKGTQCPSATDHQVKSCESIVGKKKVQSEKCCDVLRNHLKAHTLFNILTGRKRKRSQRRPFIANKGIIFNHANMIKTLSLHCKKAMHKWQGPHLSIYPFSDLICIVAWNLRFVIVATICLHSTCPVLWANCFVWKIVVLFWKFFSECVVQKHTPVEY